MTKILNTTTLTFLQETTFIFYTIAFGWIIKLIFYDEYILRAQKGLLLIVDKFVTFGARLGMLQ